MRLFSDWQVATQIVIDNLSNDKPTPGGGSAAAISASMGAALLEMAIGITIKSKKIDSDLKEKLLSFKNQISEKRFKLQNQISEDSKAFDLVMAALKIPKEDPSRKGKLQDSLVKAALVPLETAKLSYQTREIALKMEGIKKDVISDYKSGIYLLECAVKCALENVYINCDMIDDENKKNELLNEAKKYEIK
jgi:formiminotetrahydrofolate cyclodeaminase